jgi:diguanylate cyclase (GGDEF)-like protein
VADRRIGEIIELLTRLAAGDLWVRGSRTELNDDLDAIMLGINALAEELEVSREELEERVRARTAELETFNLDVGRLTELGNLLQASETTDEAYAVLDQSLAGIFGDVAGTVYRYRASRNVLERKSVWGTTSGTEVLGPADCWALRRGQAHFVRAESPALTCPHVGKRTGNSMCIPMSARGDTIGLLHLMDGDGTGARSVTQLSPAKQSLAVAVAEQTSLALANLDLRDTLRLQALRDPLTGLLNRRFVDEWIEREIALTDSSGRSFGVIMLDLDHFKQVNDVHGHDAGDSMLKAVADAIKGSLRQGDLPCRYGGEEFLVLMADIDITVLSARAEHLRERVAEVRAEIRGHPLPSPTVSAGIAMYPQHGVNALSLIHAADAALYQAKRTGRDRVVLAGSAGIADPGR